MPRVDGGLARMSLPFQDAANPLLSWTLALVGVVVIGVAKSGFGGGLGIVAVPLLILAYDENSVTALGVLLPILIAADILALRQHWRGWDRANLLHLLPGAIVGIGLGWLILSTFGEQQALNRFLKQFIGIVCVLYMFIELVKARLAPRWRFNAAPVRGGAVGIVAGIVSTLAHAAGPVTSIYLLGQHLAKKPFVATSVLLYFAMNCIKLVPYVADDFITRDTLVHSACLALFVPIGALLGLFMFQRMNDTVFRWIILLTIFGTGIKLLLEA